MSKRGSYLGGGTLVGPRTNWRWDEDRNWLDKTELDKEIKKFTHRYARALASGRAAPEVPELIQQLYAGAELKRWLKEIRRSKEFKRIQSEAQSTNQPRKKSAKKEEPSAVMTQKEYARLVAKEKATIALFAAIDRSDQKEIDALLKRGADPSVPWQGRTALKHAERKRRVHLLRHRSADA